MGGLVWNREVPLHDSPLLLRGIPRQSLPSPFDKSYFPAEIQGASKIKNLVTHWLWGKWLLL